MSYTNIYAPHVTKVYVNPTNVRPELVKGTGVVVRNPVRIRPRDLLQNPRTPALVVRKARTLPPDAVIDPATPRDRVAKKAFKDRERVLIQQVRRTPRTTGYAPGIDRAGPGSSLQPTESGAVRRRSRTDASGQDDTRAPRTRDTDGKTSDETAGRSRDIDRVDPRLPAGRPAPRTHGPSGREPYSSRGLGRTQSSLVPEAGDSPGGNTDPGGGAASPDESLREFMRETARRPRGSGDAESRRTNESPVRDPRADRAPDSHPDSDRDRRIDRGRGAAPLPRARAGCGARPR